MKIVGVMSGTSLDGMDILFCDIKERLDHSFQYEIILSTCIKYPDSWRNKLSTAISLNKLQLADLHIKYGEYIGRLVNEFIISNNIFPSLIASHGHTVFHQPEQGITLQIGDGHQIADITGITTIHDFRIRDVQLGGQGAPLVPIGDQLLFEEYAYCLNLGGFSNISFQYEKRRIAFDIGPCNLLLNHFCALMEKNYDNRGQIARSGHLIDEIFQWWNELPYFKKSPPKSLGIEWLNSNYFNRDYKDYRIEDLLHTAVEHIAFQIGNVTKNSGNILVTGGGAFNQYLIERITYWSNAQIIIPDEELINNKEALIFALLGYLRINNKMNVLSSVTGASKDHCSGKIALK